MTAADYEAAPRFAVIIASRSRVPSDMSPQAPPALPSVWAAFVWAGEGELGEKGRSGMSGGGAGP
jgi:hypothetical protein